MIDLGWFYNIYCMNELTLLPFDKALQLSTKNLFARDFYQRIMEIDTIEKAENYQVLYRSIYPSGMHHLAKTKPSLFLHFCKSIKIFYDLAKKQKL